MNSSMTVKDACVARINEICKERHITYNDLAVRSGVTPSTVYSMADSERRNLSVSTLKKLCDGLEISLKDFFDSSIFTELEQEIR